MGPWFVCTCCPKNRLTGRQKMHQHACVWAILGLFLEQASLLSPRCQPVCMSDSTGK